MLQYCRRRFFNLFDRTWLRSGNPMFSGKAPWLTACGTSHATYVSVHLAVRPATHKCGCIHCHSVRSFAHFIVILNEVKNLFNNYVQSEESFRSFANAQDDKVENQWYNIIGDGLLNLLGCVPVTIIMRTMRNTLRRRACDSLLTQRVC